MRTPSIGSPVVRPCRLCGLGTKSLYGICLAHSDLRAALDEADGRTVRSASMIAAEHREAAQATPETESC